MRELPRQFLLQEVGRLRAWRAAALRQLELVQDNRRCLALVAVVLTGFGCLVGLDLAFRYAVLDGTELPNWFNLSQEMALGEIFEHMMTGSGLLALGWMAWSGKAVRLALAAILLGLILGDNALQWHESFGEFAGPHMPAWVPLGGHEFAEFAYLCTFGLFALVTLYIVWRGNPAPREAGALFVMLCLLAAGFFGVAVDAVHTMLPTHSLAEVIIAGVEDGGELLFLTLAGAAAVCTWLADRGRLGVRENRKNHDSDSVAGMLGTANWMPIDGAGR